MSFLAVRFFGRRALMVSVTWALVALLEISIRAEDPPVTISADQLKVLQQKAAEVEQLKAKLDAAQRELESLKAAPPPAPVASKGTFWVPPAALRAQTNLPPPVPLAELPPVDEATVIPVRDLIAYFSQNAPEATTRFKGRTVIVSGVVTDVRKPLFQAQYEVNFRQLDSPLRVTCMFRPPSEFTRVYATDEGDQVVGEGNRLRTVFVRVGADLQVRGTCEGLKDGVIRLSGCAYGVLRGKVE